MQSKVFSRVQPSLHALSETRVSSPFIPRHLAPWSAKDGPCLFQRAMFCFSPTATHGSMLRLCTLTPGFKQWSGHFPQKFFPIRAATDTRGASGGFLTKKKLSVLHISLTYLQGWLKLLEGKQTKNNHKHSALDELNHTPWQLHVQKWLTSNSAKS